MQTIRELIEGLSTLAQSPCLRSDLREAANRSEAILRALRGELRLDWDMTAETLYRQACNLAECVETAEAGKRIEANAPDPWPKQGPWWPVDGYFKEG